MMFTLQEALLRPQTLLSNLYTRTVIPVAGLLSTILYPPIDYVAQIKAMPNNHEVVKILQDMINIDGAGEWAPKASHRDSWPAALQPYHDIYIELSALLPVDQICVDDAFNQSRRIEYRTRLQKLLRERVDLETVESIMSTAEDTTHPLLSADAWNGFLACVGFLRHAFRWATVPIVKVAQEEKFVDLPSELDVPWTFLRRRYGLESQGGGLMSNYFCNWDANQRLVYQVNTGMPEPIPSAEYALATGFTGSEREAPPIYYHVVQSIISFGKGQKSRCAEHLKGVNEQLRFAVRVYYEWIVESRIPTPLFVPYLQGFHGWAAGEMVDGKYTQYDGVSGGHLVVFNMLDRFLGLEMFLDLKSLANYIPARQRAFITAVEKHAFRDQAKRDGDVEVEAQLDSIVSQLRVFRSSHRKRTKRYLSNDRPERLVMTAGGGTLGTDAKLKDLVDAVDAGLERKMKDTV